MTGTIKVVGVGGLPVNNVASVALNIAAKGSGGAGRLVVYPSGVGEPTETTGHDYRNATYIHNLVIAKVGADGTVKIANKGLFPVRIYADVHGYTLDTAGTSAGSRFVGLQPTRTLANVRVPANTDYVLAPLGKGGVPASGVDSVAFTLNAKSATAGKVTVYPSGTTKSVDTNLDYGGNVFAQNFVIAKVGGDGKLIISNAGAGPPYKAVPPTPPRRR